MRIALLTIWHERNFGAEMQAYATIRALRQLGHEVEIIDIRLSDAKKYSVRGKIGRCIEYFSPAERKFQRFWKRYIPKTCRYHSIAELRAKPPKADVYMVGSDQVWNPQITRELAPIFFLDFGSTGVERGSYASSFGTNSWVGNKSITELARQQFEKFKSVSCREQTGCSILKEIFNVDAQCVLDPTLLHEEYSELIGKVDGKESLVFYPLSYDAELEAYTKKLAKRLHLEWVDANSKKYLIGRVIWQRNSIEQWISAIATAKLVITRSFHGVAFSLIYRRQFVVINDSDRSSRITDLLSQLGLYDRCFKTVEEMEFARPWEKEIDYTEVNIRLQKLKDISWNYLKRVV